MGCIIPGFRDGDFMDTLAKASYDNILAVSKLLEAAEN